MKVSTYKCDYCGRQRGESNHWLLRLKSAGEFCLYNWRDEHADDGFEHICSAECATKALSIWLSPLKPAEVEA